MGFFRAQRGVHYKLVCDSNGGNIAFSSGSDRSTVALTRVADRKIVQAPAPPA
jgi:hypothetical protein